PVVVEFTHAFLKRFHDSPDHARYFYLLDWEVALDKKSGLYSPVEYKIMDALKRNYSDIFDNNIIQSQHFLDAHKIFLFLKKKSYCTPQSVVCSTWYEKRIENNPEYISKHLGILDDMDLILIEVK